MKRLKELPPHVRPEGEELEKLRARVKRLETTDADSSRCYALIVFPNTDIYEQVCEGQMAEIIGNVVFIFEPYGLVVKKCELLAAKNIEN